MYKQLIIFALRIDFLSYILIKVVRRMKIVKYYWKTE